MTTQPRAELSDKQVGDIVIEWFESDRRVGDAFIATGRENLSMADCVAIVQTALAADRAARGGEPVAWLVSGGTREESRFGDGACMSEKDADIALVFRGAGSTKMPLYAHPAPAPADRAARVAALVVAIDALEKLNERPRPMCRDCADCDGVCVNGSGLPCDMRKCIADARNSIDALAQLAGEA